MATTSTSNVDYRLLNRLSNLVICSGCLRKGIVTPVPQVISERHRLTNECPECRSAHLSRETARQNLGKIFSLR